MLSLGVSIAYHRDSFATPSGGEWMNLEANRAVGTGDSRTLNSL